MTNQNQIILRGGDRILWVHNRDRFTNPKSTIEQVYAEYEDRDLDLYEALKNFNTPTEVISAVFPDFDESKHIARLGQEEDRSAGFPIRFLQIYEVQEQD